MKIKIISGIILIVMLFSLITIVSADETDSADFRRAANILIDLEIISETDINSDNILLKEFVLFAAKISTGLPELFNAGGITYTYDANGEPIFYENADGYEMAVRHLSERGIMDKDADLNAPVTFQEAVKILVSALNYSGLAEPAYMVKAAEENVRLIGEYAEFSFAGISEDKIITKNETIMLLYNFLLSDRQEVMVAFDAETSKMIALPIFSPVYKYFGNKLKIGMPLGNVLYSDITAYINGHAIPTSIIRGKTLVVVEDLAKYGFDVKWDGAEKTLKVELNENKEFNPIPIEKDAENKPGTFKEKYVYTNIKTYLSGENVDCFVINGVTLIDFDALGKYGNFSWDSETREIKLTLDTSEN